MNHKHAEELYRRVKAAARPELYERVTQIASVQESLTLEEKARLEVMIMGLLAEALGA